MNKKTVTVHTESGARWNVSPQLLQDCYDYMEAFKQVMDSTSKVQMDYICLQYPGYFRFAKWMERLAQGIADGVIEVPKDH
ncbi:arylsulfatase regulator [Escherichia coli]|uniref:arylsulfatase regulator n=1 Tax=Escherichia coli TaxID=562 RepID=UPI00355685D6